MQLQALGEQLADDGGGGHGAGGADGQADAPVLAVVEDGDQGGAHQGHPHLGAAQAEYQAVHGLEPGQAELQADGEHQEDHAELGEVAGLLTLRQEAEAVGADDEADGQVGQQGGQTQLLGDDDEQHRQGEQEDDAEQ